MPVPTVSQPFERNTPAERRYQKGLRTAADQSVEPASLKVITNDMASP
jgi:hypothetical protein